MRRLSIALVLVLLVSAGALAQQVELSAGAYLGSQRFTDDSKSSAVGFYVSGSLALDTVPVALNASYASVSPDKVKDAAGKEQPDEHTVSVTDFLAGYRVLPYLAVGGGWASYSYEQGSLERSSSGFALGAFGDYSMDERIHAGAKVYYVPSPKLEGFAGDPKATMFGFSVHTAYAFSSNFRVEAGYRALSVNLKNDDKHSSGGLFIGAQYAF